MADADAIRAARERDEAAADDDTEPTQDEPKEPVPDEADDAKPPEAPPAPASEKQVERGFTDAGKSAQRHGEKVAKLLGLASDDLAQCPCCDVPGFYFAGRVVDDPDRIQAV